MQFADIFYLVYNPELRTMVVAPEEEIALWVAMNQPHKIVFPVYVVSPA